MKSIPVAGADVSRKLSDMCIFSPENDVFARLKIYHDLTSMERASEALHDAEKKLGGKPIIVMESTSHYHLLLFQFFKDNVHHLNSTAMSCEMYILLGSTSVSGMLINSGILKIRSIPT